MPSNKVRLVNREVMFEDFRGEWLKEIDDVLETRGDWPSSGEPDRSGERRAEEYEQGGAYIVAGENQRGQRYECRVVPEVVDYLCDRARGRNITSERAGGVIGPVAERFKLPYTYGDRLRYSGQYVLLAAVALTCSQPTNSSATGSIQPGTTSAPSIRSAASAVRMRISDRER